MSSYIYGQIKLQSIEKNMATKKNAVYILSSTNICQAHVLYHREERIKSS